MVRTEANETSQGSSILTRATITEKPMLLRPFRADRRRLSHIPTKYKIVADARKRGDPGNRFIGNIPTASPCSNLPSAAWPVYIFLAQADRAG